MPTSARRAIAFLLVARAGGVVGAAIALVVPGPVIPLQDAAFPGVPLEAVAVAERSQPSPHIEVAPADGGADTLLVLYPGAFLRPHAYTWIGVALAPHGVRTLIPTMPLDLAILAPGRAGTLVEAHPDVERVLVGGHSLGGAMAARWARGHPRHADALVLLGAYSAGGDDLSDADLAVLVLAAEWDGLASLGEIRDGWSDYLPTPRSRCFQGRCTGSSDGTGRNGSMASRRCLEVRRNSRSSTT